MRIQLIALTWIIAVAAANGTESTTTCPSSQPAATCPSSQPVSQEDNDEKMFSAPHSITIEEKIELEQKVIKVINAYQTEIDFYSNCAKNSKENSERMDDKIDKDLFLQLYYIAESYNRKYQKRLERIKTLRKEYLQSQKTCFELDLATMRIDSIGLMDSHVCADRIADALKLYLTKKGSEK